MTDQPRDALGRFATPPKTPEQVARQHGAWVADLVRSRHKPSPLPTPHEQLPGRVPELPRTPGLY